MVFKEKKLSILQLIRYFILLFASSTFIIGLLAKDITVLLIAICSIFVHNIYFSLESFYQRIIFFAFNCTFFTFLVGRFPVKILFGYTDRYNTNQYGLDFSDNYIVLSIFVTLFLGLFFLFLGYKSIKEKQMKKNQASKRINIKKVALVSQIFFYTTFMFSLLVTFDKMRFTAIAGYTELYASFNSIFPWWFIKISEMAPVAFFVYLATMPTKRKSIIPIILYLGLGITSLFVGQRNIFMLNILIVLIYLCIRHATDNKEKWFGRKEILLSVSAFPIIIIMLNTVSYLRMGDRVEQKSLFDSMMEFFYTQSVSVNLIGYAQVIEFPEGKVYSLGRITDFLINNAVTQMIFTMPKYEAQSIESALYGNSFADTVSHSLNADRYLSGWGYGSSYIAELFKDGGYLGVIIGSFILGIILALIIRLFSYSILGAWICLFAARILLYAPRDTYTSFFVSTFSLINILTLVLIFLSVALLGGLNRERNSFIPTLYRK